MSEKIQLGVIGGSIHARWAARAHLPAVLASPDWELAAVCTTSQDSANESAKRFGARMAFADYRSMLERPDIDAIAVVLRVPSHFQPTLDSIEAGKHIFTEWPLGKNTNEAIELAALAKTKGVCTATGLQGRMHPTLLHIKQLISDGYVGEVMSCHISLFRQTDYERSTDRIWQHDRTQGGNTLTIPTGHVMDNVQFLFGKLRSVSAIVDTQVKQWRFIDQNEMVKVDAPDTIVVSGRLANGGIFSAHVAATAAAGSGFTMEIYGTAGKLQATGDDSPQLSELSLRGAQASGELATLEIPQRYGATTPGLPQGPPFNVGRIYHEFAKSIQQGQGGQPDFDDAVRLHILLDELVRSSETGQSQSL